MSQNFFGNVQFVPGLGHIEAGSVGGAPLGDDASVMMISGFGASPSGAQQYDDQRQVAYDPATGKPVQNPMMLGFLERRVVVFGIDLPVWAWVLITLGVLGAGWVFFKKGK